MAEPQVDLDRVLRLAGQLEDEELVRTMRQGVKLVDANVLLYAVNSDARHHDSARSWLDDALSGAARRWDSPGLCCWHSSA